MNKNKKSYITLTLILAVIVGVGIGAVLLKKKSDNKNNSRTTVQTSTPASAAKATDATAIATQPEATAKVATSSAPKTCLGTLTKAETEGPYYTSGSPAKTDFSLDDPAGEIITISGYVFDSTCKPIANAYLDLWHANSAGAYDNSGYTLRGHFQADNSGYYSVKTIIAGKYPGRTEHWHIKVARDSSLSSALTTQLFPPGGQSQEGDSIFDSSLLVNDFNQNIDGTRTAHFNFVIN
jgi:protocatechuate 3,4-dioxygenase beta subunit